MQIIEDGNMDTLYIVFKWFVGGRVDYRVAAFLNLVVDNKEKIGGLFL